MTSTFNHSVPSAEPVRPLAPEALSHVIRRVTSLRALRHKYAGIDDVDSPDLTKLPLLSKNEINSAIDEVLADASKRPQGHFLYGSGGTTSEPKLSLIPIDQLLPDIVREWRPLKRGEVLANLYKPGRLWSCYNFYNELGEHCEATVLPFGSIDDDELPQWLDFFARHDVSTIAATPSQITHMLEYCERNGTPLPSFRKLLWTGEPYYRMTDELIRREMPDVERYGLYGSTETWVIGHNGPYCPCDTFHIMPYQHVEITNANEILVTNTSERMPNPVLRYRLGDKGEFVACPCGEEEKAVRVIGRDDPQLKFLNILVDPDDICRSATASGEVRGVQIILHNADSPDERMEVDVLPATECDPEMVAASAREVILRDVYRLGWAINTYPRAFEVRPVSRLEMNERTGKTPTLIRR